MMSLDMNYDTILYTFLFACGINNASTTYFPHILVMVGYTTLAQKLAQVDDYKSIFQLSMTEVKGGYHMHECCYP